MHLTHASVRVAPRHYRTGFSEALVHQLALLEPAWNYHTSADMQKISVHTEANFSIRADCAGCTGSVWTVLFPCALFLNSFHCHEQIAQIVQLFGHSPTLMGFYCVLNLTQNIVFARVEDSYFRVQYGWCSSIGQSLPMLLVHIKRFSVFYFRIEHKTPLKNLNAYYSFP